MASLKVDVSAREAESSCARPSRGLAGEAVGDRAERAVGVERAVDRHGVVAVGRDRRRHRVRADQDVVGVVADDGAAVGARVVALLARRGQAALAAAVAVERRVEADVELEIGARARERDQARVHHDRLAPRIGHVVGDDLVAAALGGARDAATQRALVERLHRVGHVARLEVGERPAVGHDVLQRLDVGVVVGGEVDVAEDAVGDRVPDLRAAVARRADAVLAREVEVRDVTGAVAGGARGRRRWRRPAVCVAAGASRATTTSAAAAAASGRAFIGLLLQVGGGDANSAASPRTGPGGLPTPA